MSVPSLCMQAPTDVVSASLWPKYHLPPAMAIAMTMNTPMRSSFLLKRLAGAGGGTGAPWNGAPWCGGYGC